jgi:hypothetical protein
VNSQSFLKQKQGLEIPNKGPKALNHFSENNTQASGYFENQATDYNSRRPS